MKHCLRIRFQTLYETTVYLFHLWCRRCPLSLSFWCHDSCFEELCLSLIVQLIEIFFVQFPVWSGVSQWLTKCPQGTVC